MSKLNRKQHRMGRNGNRKQYIDTQMKMKIINFLYYFLFQLAKFGGKLAGDITTNWIVCNWNYFMGSWPYINARLCVFNIGANANVLFIYWSSNMRDNFTYCTMAGNVGHACIWCISCKYWTHKF